jgi:alkylhydroperoxidase/carboxymuconolactone decarboxylase family protein YurZ
MRYYLGVAKENGVPEGAIRETMAVAMAVHSGRVRMQAREALRGVLEPLAPA